MWKKIDSAPKDGTVVDLWAKTWIAMNDEFIYQRLTNCWWMSNYCVAHWQGLDKNWVPTHWMEIPEGPKGFRNEKE